MPWKDIHVITGLCDKLLLNWTIFVWKTLLHNMEAVYTSKRGGIITGDNHSVSLASITVHYILQPIADILEQIELFCRFIDDIVWITDSESTNICIRSALYTVYKNNGLKLTFRQICTNDDSGSVEFLDVNHCIAADSVFGFVTKDFVKPTSVGRRFITPSSVNF